MGAATCHHLAKREVSVLGLEQFDIPHGRGSHHGHSRMIRQSYYEHPDYVPLLVRAYELWDELQSAAGGERFFHRTGGLSLGPPDGSIVPGARAAACEHGLAHDVLDGAALASRFPSFKVPDGFAAFFEKNAGFLVPELAVRAHASQARANGAELHANEAILDWRASSSSVTVRTSLGTYEADHLIVTAGAWNGPLLHGLGPKLVVTRQVLAWFEPQADPARFQLGEFPCWFIETDTPFGHYGFPMSGAQPGLKLALHKPGEPIAPDELGESSHEPRPEEIESLRQILREYLPGGEGRLLAACTCLYTNSADGHFLLGPHPVFDRVSIAAGFSGHGFKFASVMGEILADLATEGGTSHPIGFLSPNRFG